MKLSAIVFVAISLAIPGSALVMEKRQRAELEFNIHPNGDFDKCVGVSNGVLAVGSAVTVFDCNGSPSQLWAWWDSYDKYNQSPLFVTNPVDNKRLCMNVANPNNFGNGAKLRLTDCLSDESSGTLNNTELFTQPYPWKWDDDTSPDIVFSMRSNTGKLMCLDLTDGSMENRNVLQLWECAPDRANNTAWKNQIWRMTIP